ncbi:MAG: dihydroorotate dehydrogenase (quinone), partial [Alphaproteobacteria bacterium]|nr:dihydroorotate dehydrogenase (quinone) [Alphaproteobacteria bacterium]
IIGVGGISSAEDAYEKIRAGASLVQIYTALPYKGPWVVSGILDGLATLLKKDGYNHVSEAVGTEVKIEEKKVKAGVG